jgi:hydroxyacyl-ACP dehydratase HTD2-like protein with hotdog domain
MKWKIKQAEMIGWQVCRACRPFHRLRLKYGHPRSREYSTAPTYLLHDLTKRQFPTLYERMSPATAEKLAVTLAPFLPKGSTSILSRLHEQDALSFNIPLPPAFHLTYFNPILEEDTLLPDGTDPAQSPGFPYERRMWAGGKLTFGPRDIHLDGSRYACVDSITNVEVKGQAPNDKVFVTIERRIGRAVGTSDKEIRNFVSYMHKNNQGFLENNKNVCIPAFNMDGADIVEERTIVFLRQREQKEAEDAKQKLAILETKPNFHQTPTKTFGKKPSNKDPSFSFTIQPSRSLLFRYSALTFNAHLIHLDSTYCRDVEFHRDLLFHGPLSLTFLITLLQSHIKDKVGPQARIREFQYRNIAPLYVEEELTICGKESKTPNEYHLWIENSLGTPCVRGTATISAPST